MPGEVNPGREQQQCDPRQPGGHRVERPVGGLGANQRAGREQVDRRIDLGDLPSRRKARLDEPLLGRVDEPPELEDGHVAFDRDRRSLSRENVVRLPMGDLDGAVPRRGELRARHQLSDPVVDQPGYPVGQRAGQVM